MDRREFIQYGGVATVGSLLPNRRLPGSGSATTSTSANGVFDVRTYGAAGNGTTDDTSAIKAAIGAALASNGGVVHFSAGVYVTSTLTLPGGITLQGIGWQSILKLKDGIDSHLVTTQGASTNYYGVVENLCLDGNRDKNKSGNGLNLIAATNFRIQNVKIMNCAGHGIALSGSSAARTIAPWIVNCGIYQCNGNGIDTDGFATDCKLHALDIGLCDKGIILPSASFLSDVTIWQCRTGLYGYWAANSHLHLVRVERSTRNGFLFEGCTDITLQECRAYENNQMNGDFDGFAFRGTPDHACARISIVGCMSGLTGSSYEKQLHGFSDGNSECVDYILCQGCVALGNQISGYNLTAGTHDVVGVNM